MSSKNMIAEVKANLKERMDGQINSMCASPDEVRLCACICEIEALQKIVAEVHAWAVCGAVATPEDMVQNLSRIVHITSPDYEEWRDIVAKRLPNYSCPNCGGNLVGDGYTVVQHCENVDITGMGIEADADTIYCKEA